MKFIHIIRVLVLLFAMVYFSEQSIAQQLPFFIQNQDIYNPSAINEDYFRYDLPTQVGIRYNYQWSKVKNAPRTLNAHFLHWNEDYNLSIGGNLINDQTGPTSFTGIYGKLAYGIKINQEWMITTGLIGGIVQYRVNGDKLNFLEPGESQNGTLTKIFPDFGLGATIYFDKKYYFGINMPQLFGLNLNFRDEQNNFNADRVRHYHANAGAYFEIYKDAFLEIETEARYVENTPLFIVTQIRHIHQKGLWIGVTGTTARSVGLDIGAMWKTVNSNIIKVDYTITNHFQPDRLSFGATYEIGLSVSW